MVSSLCTYIRQKKKHKFHKTRTPHLKKCPQKGATCRKLLICSPKKPNSARRKIAKIILSTKKKIFAYIPGIGHTLQIHNSVLVRGGRVRDIPGAKYKLIRGIRDFIGLSIRISSRSKYGTKKIKLEDKDENPK